MQALFGVIGSYVSGSGFEDIIYQLGLCQPGTMKALLKGKHYNQALMIHEAYAEHCQEYSLINTSHPIY